MTKHDIYALALEAGFMLSTQYGQDDGKMTPVSDGATLMKFAELVVEACAERAEAYAYMSPNFTALAEEIRGMAKERK